VDETYVKVGGRWKYLFRAVDKHGRLIDFTLLDRRNTYEAHRFLGKALKTVRNWPPHSITTDKLGSYPKATRRLQREGKLPRDSVATMKGFDVMRMIRRRHSLLCKPKVAGEIQIINKLFDVAA
jgi:transposase, IS6 family